MHKKSAICAENGIFATKQVVKLLIYDFFFCKTLVLDEIKYICSKKEKLNANRYEYEHHETRECYCSRL